jgi:hypothetical protein
VTARTITVGNYIKRMLLVSGTIAYKHLYKFLGQRPSIIASRNLASPTLILLAVLPSATLLPTAIPAIVSRKGDTLSNQKSSNPAK